jgi:hypothetical protein
MPDFTSVSTVCLNPIDEISFAKSKWYHVTHLLKTLTLLLASLRVKAHILIWLRLPPAAAPRSLTYSILAMLTLLFPKLIRQNAPSVPFQWMFFLCGLIFPFHSLWPIFPFSNVNLRKACFDYMTSNYNPILTIFILKALKTLQYSFFLFIYLYIIYLSIYLSSI